MSAKSRFIVVGEKLLAATWRSAFNWIRFCNRERSGCRLSAGGLVMLNICFADSVGYDPSIRANSQEAAAKKWSDVLQERCHIEPNEFPLPAASSSWQLKMNPAKDLALREILIRQLVVTVIKSGSS